MFKVLIIDDEEPVREAIRLLGEWDRFGISNIFEADNGKQALEIIKKERPNIVFVDMKMPELDGVHYLQTAEQEYPDILHIVVSGYGDFEFTKQAVRSKVVDYLLKPVNKEELNNALMKTVKMISEKRKQQSEIIDTNIALNISLRTLKEKNLLLAIEGNLTRAAYEDYVRIINSKAEDTCFSVALLRIMNLDEVNAKYFDHDLSLMFFSVTNITDEICGHAFKCFSMRSPKTENMVIVNLSCGKELDNDNNRKAYEMMRRVSIKLKELFGIVSAIGIGSFCTDFTMLNESYKCAEKYLYSINLLDMKNVIINKDIGINTPKVTHILYNKDFIENAIACGSQMYVKNIVSKYFNEAVDTGYFSLRDADKTIKEITLMMYNIALEKGIPEEIALKYEENISAIGISFDYATFKDFEKIVYNIIDYFYSQITQHIKSVESFNIHEVKEYIDRNYHRRISISVFTDKHFFSREYLMKLFKKTFGCGIHEYVIKVKMEKAIELMNDSELTIQSISEMLGYSNSNYFSKAFKNYYGIAPSDYRLNAN